MMKFLKLALLSSLLLSTMVFANAIERLTGNLGLHLLIQDYQEKGYQKPFKEMIIENASDPQSYPKITEGTNLNADNYVWKVSYSPYSDDGNIVLLNPHPTLEVLNQRAVEITKQQVTPLREKDKQYLKELFSDEGVEAWQKLVSNEEKERIKPLLVKFTDQDIQKIIDIKQEMQINFGTFKKDVAPNVRQTIRSALIRSYCGDYFRKSTYAVNLQATVAENGRISNIKIDGIEDRSLVACLSKSIRRQKFMIMNKDGLPVSYDVLLTANLENLGM